MDSKKILYFQYTDPAIGYPPLEHSSAILARKGWKVLFLGVTQSQGYFRLEGHPKIKMKRLFCPKRGWGQKLNYVGFNLWVIGWVIRFRPTFVYASDQLSCLVTLVLSYTPGLKVIYHEHDSPNFLEPRITFFMKVVFWARSMLAKRACLCIVPNERRMDNFIQETEARGKVVCVWNSPAKEEVSPPLLPWAEKELRILYHGSLVPPRLPLAVIEALALLPKSIKLIVIGYETIGHPAYIRQIERRALERGIAERVEIVGAVSTRRKLFEWCRRCDVGLTLMPKESKDINMQFMTGASNKPFDYLACGLALLVSDLPDWKTFFVEPGYGLTCDPEDPESIAEALHWFLEHPKEMRMMGEKGRQKILSDWNYEKQFEPVLNFLEKAVIDRPK